jgi:cytochrome c551
MRSSLRIYSLRLWRNAAVIAVCVAAVAPLIAGSNSNAGARDRGADLFAVSGCAYCHGKAGVGGGVGPDLQLVRKRRKREQIVKQITEGGKGMPPFREVFASEQIDDLVAFLEAKRKVIVVPKPVVSTPTPSSAN